MFWVGIGIAIVYLILAIWIGLASDSGSVRRRLGGALIFTVLVIIFGGSQYWLGAFIAVALILVGLVIGYVKSQP